MRAPTEWSVRTIPSPYRAANAKFTCLRLFSGQHPGYCASLVAAETVHSGWSLDARHAVSSEPYPFGEFPGDEAVHYALRDIG